MVDSAIDIAEDPVFRPAIVDRSTLAARPPNAKA
jgi:hypothetical protein